MTKGQSDIAKITDILIEFFKSKRIRDSLKLIHECKITGWEKWWQTELCIFLANHERIAEWDMEHHYDTDKRSNLAQNTMALDVGFRFKNERKDEWLFIELKQHDDYVTCLINMGKDIIKVSSARSKSFNGIKIRFLACAGIFLKSDKETVMNDTIDVLDELGVDDTEIYLENVSPHHQLIVF